MQYAFGVGFMAVTQLTDASGNLITTPTPYPLLTMQSGSIDLSSDIVELAGQNQYAAAIARGKGKASCKVQFARVFGAVWNAIYFGQTLTPGLIAVNQDLTGAPIPATPYEITVTPPGGGTFMADEGVLNSALKPLSHVAAAPTTGQYMVNPATGQYTFSAADTGSLVYINYKYSNSSTAGPGNQTVKNLPMGYAPTFSADLCVTYAGKIVTFGLLSCVASKFSFGLKNADFTVPEMEFSMQDNGLGQIMTWSTSE